MTSSMLAGERRWASSRRGGMTVLGKVAVPKPLNLPSQKLENHGVDPNVEIVPKGSLSWGSRSSSATLNPWGSTTLTPNADGTTGSPTHPSGRPSSGGGLNRPSTTGSDKIHEHAASAWGPNSRPSSASGVLTSNQSMLTSSRPHSAETRPSSSHLSRFAEPVFDNSVAWGPNATAEKLLMPTKNDDFYLSSGDFPTLGSEKDNARKSNESHDLGSHVRPSSATDGTAPTKEKDVISKADKSGTINTWTRDETPHVEDGVRPRAEKWQGEPQQYINPNVPPHFDAWCGPMNSSAGVWYRGAPGGPPYPPVAHGGFPMEPFPYYRPQIPPALANSQPGHHPGVGPRGHRPENGDFYRPQMPDAFIRPGMPVRPGFFPGPVPYDGYYGPPMGYNPNERDIPFMGMPPGPRVHMHPSQNPSEHSDTHLTGGCGSTMLVSEQLGSVRLGESQGSYRVLRKRENEGDAEMEENFGPTTAADSLSLEKDDFPRPSYRKNEQGTDNRRKKDAPSRRNTFVENPSSRNLGNRGQSSDSIIVHYTEVRDSNAYGERKSEIGATSFQEVPQVIPAKPEDSSLLQKIEGLNAKVRASDVHEDAASGSLRGEQKNRRAHNVVQSRADHHSKGRLDNQDADGWGKKPPILGSESAVAVSNQNVGHATTFQVPDHLTSIEADEKSETKNAGGSLTPMFDSGDGRVQHAKMREWAKQRSIQLQREEEERIREQKAKALAKLEELNRHTLAADGTTQNVEKSLIGVTEPQNVDISLTLPEPVSAFSKHGASSSALDARSKTVAQISKSSTSEVGRTTALSRDSHLETPKNFQQEPVVSHGQSLPLKQNVATNDESKVASLFNDDNLSRQKRAGQRRKPSDQVEESLSDKSTLIGTIESPIGHTCAVIQNSGTNVAVSGLVSSVPNNLNILPESATLQRQKTNGSSKNKNKLDAAAPPATDSAPSASKETNLAKICTKNGKPKSSQFELDPSAESVIDGTDAAQPDLEQNSSVLSEEAHGRANNQHKPQHYRGTPRNTQANRSVDRSHGGDAVMWAPVRTQNKAEPGDEANQRTVQDAVPQPAKSNNRVSYLKSKRTEMERYVPKPVAKELAQQGSIQQAEAPSSPGKSILEEGTKKEELYSQHAIRASGSVGPVVESKSGDSKQIRQVKSHGARRQRGPTELHHGHCFQQGSTSNSSVTYEKSTGQHEASSLVPTETNITHEWDPSDGWYMPEYPPTEAAPVTSLVNDQGGGTGKGRTQTYKGQRAVNNHDTNYKDVNGAEVDKNFTQCTSHEMHQTDRPVSSKENHSSHWQPKSHARRGGGKNVSSEIKKDSPHDGSMNFPPETQPEESFAEYKNAREAPRAGHQEGRRERPASFKGQPHSPNQGHGNMEHVPLDFRKNGGQNNRSAGQDNRQQHNSSANQERQRQNSHYEYQPVESNNSKSKNSDAPADGSRSTAPRYRERGTGQSRRGGSNFCWQQSGAVRIEAGYE